MGRPPQINSRCWWQTALYITGTVGDESDDFLNSRVSLAPSCDFQLKVVDHWRFARQAPVLQFMKLAFVSHLKVTQAVPGHNSHGNSTHTLILIILIKFICVSIIIIFIMMPITCLGHVFSRCSWIQSSSYHHHDSPKVAAVVMLRQR